MLNRVVVTGAGGFLGGHLVHDARGAGAEVVPVVREARGAGEHAMRAVLADPSVLAGTDLLVHSAAIRHRYGASPSSYRASNVDLVEALLRASQGRVRRFLYVSSVGVYGFPAALPVSERTPFEPRTLYSATKIEAEKLVRHLAPQLGLGFTIVRPTIFYGRGDTNGMLDKLAERIRKGTYLTVGAGDNELHHTYVGDVARGVLELGEADAARNEDFIVAGPETITLARLGALVARAVGKELPRWRVPLPIARAVATAIDVAAYQGLAFVEREPPLNHEKLDVMTVPIAFDTRKAAEAGFTARVGYEEGILATLGS